MDGNGRWAERCGLPRSEGHLAGVDVVKKIVRACKDKSIPVLSIWAFGSENWARPIAEVEFLMQLFVTALTRELDALHEEEVRLCFTGSRQELPAALQEWMHRSETKTGSNKRLMLNIVMNYGGKWDIVQAAKKIANKVSTGMMRVEEINEETFAQELAAHHLPHPDLFIRTSGEQRISNFFLWQLAYTELYFSQLSWPEFTVAEFELALNSFASRERRFGQTSMQIIEKNYV